jgi:uncharacterized repeat protein (TIGR01451 family)
MWRLGTLAPEQGGSIVVTTTLVASAGPAVDNHVLISTDTLEGNYDNNEDELSTPVTIDLEVVKSDDPEPGVLGGLLTYTLVYTNHGPFVAREVYITDTFPVSVTYDGIVVQPSGWTHPPDYDAGPPVTLTWYTPTLAAGASGRIVYTVIAGETISGTIDNRACISNTIDDWFVQNNCDIEPTAVELLSFTTVRLPGAVVLSWETAVEIDSYGFVLLRSASGRVADAEEFAFVAAKGRGGGGAAYSYLDRGPPSGLERGLEYTFWLVEVDRSGKRTTFGTTLSAAFAEYPHQIYLPFSWGR